VTQNSDTAHRADQTFIPKTVAMVGLRQSNYYNYDGSAKAMTVPSHHQQTQRIRAVKPDISEKDPRVKEYEKG
jgi:predicted P-loop ATPase/GTPase